MLEKKIYEFEGFGFKFGMYASAITQKVSGTNIGGLIKKMSSEGESEMAILHYFYGGAVAYEEHKKTGREVSVSDVADMLETIGDAKALEIFNESLGVPKNLEAPQKTGQTETEPT